MNTLSLLSKSESPCGVESFARKLATELRERRDGRHEEVRLSGEVGDLRAFRRSLRETDLVVMNTHLVAWKRVIVQPLIALLLTRLSRKDLLVIVHEWADLDWRRRAVLAPGILLANRIMASSPRVERQVRASWLSPLLARRRAVVPIPPNLDRPDGASESDLTRRLAALRESGRTLIGQFGSIYPKKRNTAVLDVAAELRRRNRDVFLVFVGSFMRGQDNIEEQFAERLRALELDEHVMVTGYVSDPKELFSVLRQVSVFVYSFEDGLTSNRSSVLTCLQAGRPVVVNAPRLPNEFDHHPTFREQLSSDRLKLVSADADPSEYADAVERAAASECASPDVDSRRMWKDVLESVDAAWRRP